MTTDTMPTPSGIEAAAHEVLVANLRNAHALEKQAITVMQAQLKLFDDYPDLHARVTEHIVETRDQARRLEAGLEACGTSTSLIKDAFLSVMGLGQSSMQGFGDDAVLKAVIADSMTEHLEIRSYRMLITLAELAGKPDLRPRLEETLREEEAMANWIDRNLDAITQRFVELKARGDQPAADEPAEGTATDDGEPPKTVWQTLEEGGTEQPAPQPVTPDGATRQTPDGPGTDPTSGPDRAGPGIDDGRSV